MRLRSESVGQRMLWQRQPYRSLLIEAAPGHDSSKGSNTTLVLYTNFVYPCLTSSSLAIGL
jgi:hypothetical protein